MEAHAASGARAVKMKVGGAPLREDIARVAAVRAAIGETVKLLLDANNGYRRHEAIQAARAFESYEIYWLEEPLMPDDYAGHAAVARTTTIPIAAGENEYTRYGFRDLIEHESASILNPDAQFVGGVTEFMKVAALAQAHDLPVAPHGNPELHVHLASALPNALFVEVARVPGDTLLDLFFPQRLSLEDGCVRPSDRPGFGIELKEEALEEFRVA
jgi:D-arabinonate dehydratase